MNQRHWLKNYGTIPADIDPKAHRSVLSMMDDAMTQFSDQPAFTFADQTLTFGEVERLSLIFSAFLQKRLNVKKGDRIAVMLPNLMAFPIVFLGIIRTGAIQVNVNPLYTARELEHQLNDAGAEIIVVFSGSLATVVNARSDTVLKHVITVNINDCIGIDLPGTVIDENLENSIRLSEIMSSGEDLQFDPVDLHGEDLLLLQYTGGTTGLSKGAALSHRNLVANVEQFKAFMPDNVRVGKEVVVTALPLYHIFALMVNFLTYFSVGARNWLVANPRDIDSLIDIMHQSQCTVFMGVNTLYAGLVASPRLGHEDWSHLRLAGGGGASIIEAVSAKWSAVSGMFIREGYGLSETSPVLTFNPGSVEKFNGTTGLPLPSTYIKLLDDDGQEVAIGNSGEVVVNGPQVMRGYWNKPDIDSTSFTSDGYFKTGDIGIFDQDGFLKIVDRKKDMILVSGFNVFPNEVESVATNCAGIMECACIGVPDEKTGEAVRLYVTRLPGTAIAADDVINYCRQELAAYKIPRQIVFVSELPKSAVGKILRRELRS